LSPRNIKMAVFDRAIELARNTVPASWRDILGTARGPAQRHFRNCLYEFLVSLASDQSRHPFQNRHWVNFRRNSEPRNRTLTLRLWRSIRADAARSNCRIRETPHKLIADSSKGSGCSWAMIALIAMSWD
jgi:hypothetical protein